MTHEEAELVMTTVDFNSATPAQIDAVVAHARLCPVCRLAVRLYAVASGLRHHDLIEEPTEKGTMQP